MDSGFYAACAGLVARTQALDTIAANVANTSSNGFRGQQDVFGGVLAAAHGGKHLSAINQVTNSFGVLSGTRLDQTQGTVTRTGNDLDLAIEGSGYFKIQTAHGIAYTRNGSFQVSAAGQLTTATGDAVLGEAGPISLGKGPVTISSDGTVSSGGAISGKLKLVAFAPTTDLTSRGAALYTAPPDKELEATDNRIQQGALEGSNVSPVDGIVQLIGAQRSAESMRHILSMLDSEMDKTAAQDLPRVS